jgi:lactoylglutathione lyase
MFIEHIAIWVKDIEKMKIFYERYFNCTSNDKYYNHNNNFESYFLSFKNGVRLELMNNSDIPNNLNNSMNQYIGINHLAIKIRNKDDVKYLTEKLKQDGYIIVAEPRETGDGYYESCILDPENNRIEIVA